MCFSLCLFATFLSFYRTSGPIWAATQKPIRALSPLLAAPAADAITCVFMNVGRLTQLVVWWANNVRHVVRTMGDNEPQMLILTDTAAASLDAEEDLVPSQEEFTPL